MSGPLEGLKVIEMLGLGPAPLAGQLLADLGAEVIIIDRKVDEADKTDIHRRNKKSVALNLKTTLGKKAAKKSSKMSEEERKEYMSQLVSQQQQ